MYSAVLLTDAPWGERVPSAVKAIWESTPTLASSWTPPIHHRMAGKQHQLTKWAPTKCVGIKQNSRCIWRNTMHRYWWFSIEVSQPQRLPPPLTPLESSITDRLKDSCSQNKGITCTHIGLSHKIDQWGSMEDGTSLQINNSAVQHCERKQQIAFNCLLRQCLHTHTPK